MTPARDVPQETEDEWIARQLASAPPLNAEQREVISGALRRKVTDPAARAVEATENGRRDAA